jgi:extradiol dioxygenase family protein
MPKISGVTHWAVPVNDLAESERFYAEVVGLEPRGRLGGPNGDMSCFLAGDQSILLCQQPVTPPAGENLVHYSFTLTPEEWERGVRHLWQSGVRPTELLYRERGHFPGRELYFNDPSGNRLEFRDPAWQAGMPKPTLEEIVGAG